MELNHSILEGRMFPALTRFTLPILLSLILQALYGAVDLWMVSQFATQADISAVSTGSQTIMITNGIVTGLSMGTTILLGQAIGQRNHQKSAHIMGTSLWIFFWFGIALSLFLTFGSPFIAHLFNVPAKAFEPTTHYISICGLGTLFMVGFNILSSIFYGIGDSKTPLLFVGIACVFNIIGDYLLVHHFHLGASGTAIATILAQALSVIYSLCVIQKKLPFAFHKQDCHFYLPYALAILKLGTPIAFLRMCNEMSYLFIIGFVNTLGVVSSAGVGIAEKLVMFILLIPTAYMSSISTFVAQNMGANQPQRAKNALWTGMKTSAIVGSILAYTSFFHGDFMSQFFVKDLAVIEASAQFLKATSLECLFFSLACCFDGYFNGIEHTRFVMIQGIVAALCVRIPYAYFASLQPHPQLFNIGLSTAFAAFFMLVMGTLYYQHIKKQEP